MDEILATAQRIGTILAEIVLAIYFCKQYIDKMNPTGGKLPIGEAVKEQNEIDLEIIKQMDYYKELLNADRILLFEFHNGHHYSNYRSALKMSASYETYRAGLGSSRANCTNLPLSIMPEFISSLTSEGKVFCGDIEEIKESMVNSYTFKKAIGIQAFYDIAIRDKSNNVVGFVAVQWNTITDLSKVNVKNIEKLAWFLEESIKKLTNMDETMKKKERNIFKR